MLKWSASHREKNGLTTPRTSVCQEHHLQSGINRDHQQDFGQTLIEMERSLTSQYLEVPGQLESETAEGSEESEGEEG